MKEQLKKILPENRVDEFFQLGKENQSKPQIILLKQVKHLLKIAYVFKGLFRYVYLNDKGDEFTKGIITENLFISSYSAMILGKAFIFLN
jgi:hypothetical protein